MSQYDFGTIDPATKSGTALAGDLNSWRTALNSLHSGSSRPSYAVAGQVWLDTTSSPWIIKIFDGSDDIAIGTVDATANSFAVTLNNDAVTTAKINNGAVTVAKLATVAGNAGKLVAYDASGVPTVVSAGTDTYPLVSNGTGLPAFEQIATGGIADAAVTVAKISAAGSTAGQVLTSNGSSAAPSFQNASGGTASHLAVGSYATLVNSTAAKMNAGSSYTTGLRYGFDIIAFNYIVHSSSALTQGTAITGQTWMCMGANVPGRYLLSSETGNYGFYYGLFLRTA
jgi:hypothetical protein